MLSYGSLRHDIRDIKGDVNKLEKKVDDIHKVLYCNGDGLQGRLVKTEVQAATALRTVLARTAAMWTVLAFALLAIGGILGYQMYRIDGLVTVTAKIVQDISNYGINPFGMCIL